MAGPNDPFNNRAVAGRDPDPQSFPPIRSGPIANLLTQLGSDVPTLVSKFMEKMETEIREGKRKREDGYIGVMDLQPRQDGLPPNQLVIVQQDIPGERYGKLMFVERVHETEDSFKRKQRDQRYQQLQGINFSGDGYYMGSAAVFYHMQGNYVNFRGESLHYNGQNAVVDPYSPQKRLQTHGPDRVYDALMQQIDPQKFGLSRELTQQVKQRVPNGAVPILGEGNFRPGQTAPGSAIPGAIDVDTLPPAPPAGPASAPAVPARPTGGAAAPAVNTTGLATALVEGGQSASTAKPPKVSPRPDIEP